MNIIDSNGERIKTLNSWAKLYATPMAAHQWKEHRSARSIAEFIVNLNGADLLQARVSEALGENVEFQKSVPEWEIRFYDLGRGRVHDLAIDGHTKSGKTLFVGVEAKVDEHFGPLVQEEYLAAKARQIAGISTKAPERIEQLLRRHFAKPDASMFSVRYQLLYATAVTLAAGAEVSVLYVVVFKTLLDNETTGAENYRDYVDFMAKAGATPLKLPTKEVNPHRLRLGGKELLCLHEYFELCS